MVAIRLRANDFQSDIAPELLREQIWGQVAERVGIQVRALVGEEVAMQVRADA